LQPLVSLNIHNRCQNINLISPVYFIHGGRWHVAHDPEADASAIMRNYIEFDSEQDILEGALVYRIQEKRVKTDKSVQVKPKRAQFLVIWRGEYTRELHVRTLLVEDDEEINWTEDKLKQLHQKYWHPLNTWVDPIEDNWLLNSATVLKTTIKAINDGYRRDMFISERTKTNFKRPLWIDAER
jgi:hypothetical protein